MKIRKISTVFGGASPLLYLNAFKEGFCRGKIYSNSKLERNMLFSLYGVTPKDIPNKFTEDILFATPTVPSDFVDLLPKINEVKMVIIDFTNLKQTQDEISEAVAPFGKYSTFIDITPDTEVVPQAKTYNFVILRKAKGKLDIKVSFAGFKKNKMSDIIENSPTKKYYLSPAMIEYVSGVKTPVFDRGVCLPLRKLMHKMNNTNRDNYYTDSQGIRRLTPHEVAKILGYDFGDKAFGVYDTRAYEMLATSTPVPVVQALLEGISMTDDLVLTKETLEYKGKTYLYDGILAFSPIYRKGKTYSVVISGITHTFDKKDVATAVTSKGRRVIVVQNMDSITVRKYLDVNMPQLATREHIGGTRWYDMIPLEESNEDENQD